MTIALITSSVSRWIDAVASFIVALRGRFAKLRTIKIFEAEGAEFVLGDLSDSATPDLVAKRIRIADGEIVAPMSEQLAIALRGSRVELTLKPDRFLFRPLELPQRAGEFLDGIIRAQIDRLTPWTAREAAFGWSKPSPVASDRIMVTVVATARSLIEPYLQGLVNIGAQSIAVLTTPPEQEAAVDPIKVMEARATGFLNFGRIRKILIVTLVTTGAVAATGLAGSALIGIRLDAQHSELAHRIAAVRAAVESSRDAEAGSLATAQHNLEVRKHAAASTVIIMETLSRILPDDTYATELRIQDQKMQLIGVTHNAPALIGLIERSDLFAHATFFAPTTHSSSEPGERFHIEASIQPSDTKRP